MTVLRLPSVKPVPRFLAVALAAATVIASVGAYMVLNPGTPVASVPTAEAQWGVVKPFVSVTGSVGNNPSVNVSSAGGGQIVRWLVSEGSTVKAGEPIAYFSTYATNSQLYAAIQSELGDAHQMETVAEGIQASEAKSLATSDAIAEDRTSEQLAFSQLLSAAQTAVDAANQVAQTSSSAIRAAKNALDQANAQVAVAQSDVSQAATELQGAGEPQASAATIQQDESNVSVLEQELQNAQSQYAVDLAANSTLNQAAGQVNTYQSELSNALSQLASDQAANASTSVIQLDEANVTALQQDLENAQEQYSLDQSSKGSSSSSLLRQDQNNISTLQTQLTAAQEQLNVDKTATQPAYVLQDDLATVNTAEQQLSAAQIVATQEAQAYQEAVTTASSDTGLGMHRDVGTLDAAENKLLRATAAGAARTTIQRDQTSVERAAGRVQNDVILYAESQRSLAAATSPTGVTDAVAALDQAVGTMRVDASSWTAAEVKLATDQGPAGRRQLLGLEQSVLQDRETASQVQQALVNARAGVEQSELRSPVNGVVTSLAVATGTRVAPDQPAATILPAGAEHQVVALVPSSQIDQIHAGQSVWIQSPDAAGTGKGVVDFVSPLPAQAQQGAAFQYPVYINVKTFPKGFGPGMMVSCDIYTAVHRHVVVVPAAAVMVNNGALGVYVKRDGVYHFIKVKIGVSDSKSVQVKNLRVGTQVALQRP